MIGLLGRKLFHALLSLFVVVTLTFVLMNFIPGDPFRQEQALPKEIYEALLDHYGLNKPLSTQYFNYLKQLVTFDLGPSFIYTGRTVTQIIKSSLPISAFLGIEALLIAVPSGILLGILAAINQNRWQDILATLFAIIGISIPSYILATLLQYVFAFKFELLPIARWGSFSHTLLPAISLAALPTAFITRFIRAKMLVELRQDYIRTARAKGLPEYTIIIRHALKNTLIPLLGYLGPLTANILTGSFVIEKIFSIPGLGFWFVTSVINRDYTMIMGITVFYCALLLLIVFTLDTFCILLDPRISYNFKLCKRR